jgi:hypothetical protein
LPFTGEDWYAVKYKQHFGKSIKRLIVVRKRAEMARNEIQKHPYAGNCDIACGS